MIFFYHKWGTLPLKLVDFLFVSIFHDHKNTVILYVLHNYTENVHQIM